MPHGYATPSRITLERHFNGGDLVIADGPAKGRFRLIFRESEFSQALPEDE